MTLSSTELSVLVEFLPLLRFPCFVSCLSFLAKDCQGKELRLVTLVNTSRELGSLVTGLHTVLAAVTWSRPQWCSARSVWGLLLLPAPLLPASVAPVRALWFLLPSNNITWVKKKKSQKYSFTKTSVISVTVWKSRQGRSNFKKLEKFKNNDYFFTREVSKLLGAWFLLFKMPYLVYLQTVQARRKLG